MRKSIYYVAGALCLLLAVALLVDANAYLTRIIPYNRFDNEYLDYYSIGFTMPKNSLQQKAVYLPVYDLHHERCLDRFLVSFGMACADVISNDEYHEATGDNGTIRIHRYIDLLEFEGAASGGGSHIEDTRAIEIAEEFSRQHLFLDKPYDIDTRRKDDEITIILTPQLSNLPNRAFPTEIVLGADGKVKSARHFYFEYEVLGYADVITVKIALAELPREHENKIYLKSYELVYVFEDSVLQPVYVFYGEHSNGETFLYQVKALRFN